jgi:glycosyltransferase involved in cell wall biosynthesis
VRVVVVCGAGMVSGKEIMVLNLMSGLMERGHECFCITSDWGHLNFKNRLRASAIAYSDLRIGFFSTHLKFSTIRMTLDQIIHVPILYWKYLKLMRSLNADVIVHTNLHHLLLLYPLLSERNSVYWSHEFVGDTRFYRRLFRMLSTKVLLFCGVSNAVSDSLKRVVDHRKIVTIHNGIKVVDTQKEIIKTRTNQTYVLGVVGQVSHHKGHGVLFEAIKLLTIRRDDFYLKIVGSGSESYRTELEKMSDDLGISKHLRWMGFEEDQDKIYSDIDLIIVPSIEPDPYPTVVMEAGVRGIPVIASDTGGLPEMIREGHNGSLFRTGDPEALMSSVNRFLNGEYLAQMKMNSYEHARLNFSTDSFIGAFEDVLVNRILPLKNPTRENHQASWKR